MSSLVASQLRAMGSASWQHSFLLIKVALIYRVIIELRHETVNKSKNLKRSNGVGSSLWIAAGGDGTSLSSTLEEHFDVWH